MSHQHNIHAVTRNKTRLPNCSIFCVTDRCAINSCTSEHDNFFATQPILTSVQLINCMVKDKKARSQHERNCKYLVNSRWSILSFFSQKNVSM